MRKEHFRVNQIRSKTKDTVSSLDGQVPDQLWNNFGIYNQEVEISMIFVKQFQEFQMSILRIGKAISDKVFFSQVEWVSIVNRYGWLFVFV